MDWLKTIIDFILHIDDHLQVMIGTYGGWTYGILFLIIFAETGLVITPFLPGDSLLFAAGALSATSSLNPVLLFVLLVTLLFWVIRSTTGPDLILERISLKKMLGC